MYFYKSKYKTFSKLNFFMFAKRYTKKSYPILLLLVLLVQIAKSQTNENKLAVGFSLGKNLYVGDYGGNGIIDFGHSEPSQGYLYYGLSLGIYLSPALEFGFQSNYGDYGYFNSIDYTNLNYPGVDAPNNFLAIKYQASTSLKYKFHFSDDDDIIPFVSVGMGLAGYTRNLAKDKDVNPETGEKTAPRGNFDGIDLIIPIGLGIRYQISNNVAIQYQYNYNFTNNDTHDTHMSGKLNTLNYDFEHRSAGNDAFGEHIITILYSFDLGLYYNDSKSWKKSKYKGYKANSWKSYNYRN